MDQEIPRKTSRGGLSRWIGALGLLTVLCLGSGRSDGGSRTPFVRGDVDQTGTLSVTDAVRILQHLFLPGGESPPISCEDAADADDSGTIDLTDAVYILNALFRGGPPPPDPFPRCGPDFTPDDLGCAEYAGCLCTYYGIPVDGDGVFFVLEGSVYMAGSGELTIEKRQTEASLDCFEDGAFFGVVLFDEGVEMFPASGTPAVADDDSRVAGDEFVRGFGLTPGACVQDGLRAAVEMARRSPAQKKQLFFVGSGRGVCGEVEEAAYLRETLDVVTALNDGEVEIHTLSVLPVKQPQVDFLTELAERNGGTYSAFYNLAR